MVLLQSDPVQLGSAAPSFSNLPGTDGASYSLDDFTDSDVLVVAFICNHCPYVKAVASRLVTLQEEFASNGVKLVGINSNDTNRYPADSFPKMKEFTQQYAMNFPYLFDESQEVAKAYGAVCTPDIFVFDRDRTLQYRGRIDDNWRNAASVTRRELAEALQALTNNGEVPTQQNPSIGCSIKWKPGNAP